LENKLAYERSPARLSTTQPWKAEATIRLYNKIDDLRTFKNNSCEGDPSYHESDELVMILDEIMSKVEKHLNNDYLVVKK